LYCPASSPIRVKTVVPTSGSLELGVQMLFIGVLSLRPNADQVGLTPCRSETYVSLVK
jgi:hypothetical protein